MNKDENLSKRKELARKLIDNPEKESVELILKLSKLMSTKATDERVQIVSEIMQVHPRTIWRYYIE